VRSPSLFEDSTASPFFRDRSADKAANAVVLPLGSFDDFGHGGSLFPTQEFKNALLLGVLRFARFRDLR